MKLTMNRMNQYFCPNNCQLIFAANMLAKYTGKYNYVLKYM